MERCEWPLEKWKDFDYNKMIHNMETRKTLMTTNQKQQYDHTTTSTENDDTQQSTTPTENVNTQQSTHRCLNADEGLVIVAALKLCGDVIITIKIMTIPIK